ncbi:hypothetical protein QYF61_023234 [Mycteria americana]|uniref:Uncharacterized protein n=1 Tax=Mycteria americana TaxID=33587 RepID=A0AAN7N4E7_MYCAM|nr:hypothetical protein QYF61_023234 [Mycteria americana]
MRKHFTQLYYVEANAYTHFISLCSHILNKEYQLGSGSRTRTVPKEINTESLGYDTKKVVAKQPQVPQLLLIRLVLQTLHQLCCPSLDTLQHLNVSLVVGGPKLNTVFEVRPHQCRVQGDHHFPTPAGHAIFDTSQDAIGFLGHLGTLLAHIQAAVNQHPQVLFCQAAFQPLFPKPAVLHGVAVAQVQDPALGLLKPHTTDLSPSIQPVQVPLQSLPTLKQINTPTQLGVICKLTEGAFDPLVQIIDKDIEQNRPQHRALGNTTLPLESSCAKINRKAGGMQKQHQSPGGAQGKTPARACLTIPMMERDRLGGSWGHPRAPGKCVVEARTKVRLGHQSTSGPGSAVPVAGQGRAVAGLEASTLQHHQCKTDGPGGLKWGPVPWVGWRRPCGGCSNCKE